VAREAAVTLYLIVGEVLFLVNVLMFPSAVRPFRTMSVAAGVAVVSVLLWPMIVILAVRGKR
jgi:hypothetical protein